MTHCNITGYEILYNGLHMICVPPDSDEEYKSCYVTPSRWEDSSCPFKYKFRRVHKIKEYKHHDFVDIGKWLRNISTVPEQ